MRKEQIKKVLKLCIVNGMARDRENPDPFAGLDMTGEHVIARAREALGVTKPGEFYTEPLQLFGMQDSEFLAWKEGTK